MSDLERSHRRLEHLYEISKLLASFETVEQTFDLVVGIAARTLPLRSVILIETGGSRMITWPSEGQSSAELQAVKKHVREAYAYLVGVSTESIEFREEVGTTTLPRQTGTEANNAKRLIVLPLAVANGHLFGALQLEGAQPLDKMDLMFVNAITNQLAVALDRDRAWQRDITRREHAEEGRSDAEARRTTSEQALVASEEGRTNAVATGARAERRRIVAEISSEKYEALAAENARLYEQAQQAVRAREQLLAIVSHDLRSPLGTIVMAADVLSDTGDPPRAVGSIQRAANRMLRLIEDLLDFASIEAGHLAMRRQPQDPGAIIQETLATFEGVAQAKGQQLTAELEPGLPKIHCDPDRILQVLANLVGNATKAAAEGGQITLRAEAREHEVWFAVSDNGPGISPEDAQHLFERYWRSDEAEYKGTGLGLAIARGIVSAHGGRIWVESELGRGATFHFTIPMADVTSLFAVPEPHAAASTQSLTQAKGT